WMRCRSVGTGRATLRACLGLRYYVIRLIAEPLPAASRPSHTTTRRLPVAWSQACISTSSACSRSSSALYAFLGSFSSPLGRRSFFRASRGLSSSYFEAPLAPGFFWPLMGADLTARTRALITLSVSGGYAELMVPSSRSAQHGLLEPGPPTQTPGAILVLWDLDLTLLRPAGFGSRMIAPALAEVL